MHFTHIPYSSQGFLGMQVFLLWDELKQAVPLPCGSLDSILPAWEALSRSGMPGTFQVILSIGPPLPGGFL